uniref:Tumor necrosis factor receptor superfamily, member 1B n=2 Tax=Nothobranchius rachovii TaxID=451742 RepID=A0A1A8RFH7_9TELE
MKDMWTLLVLLGVQTTKVCCLPYQPDSDGNCLNQTTVYLQEDLNLCCKKCSPGHRLKAECSDTRDSVCEPCGPGMYTEYINYSPNCFSCTKCKEEKHLEPQRNCTSTQNAKCVCKPGHFCHLGFKAPYCDDCRMYTKCKPGFGVVGSVKPDADVKCEPCPSGTFSDKLSYSDHCRARTSDTTTVQLPSTRANLVPTVHSRTTSTRAVASVVSANTSPPTMSHLEDEHVAVTAGVVGFFLLLSVLMLLLFLYKIIYRKDVAKSHPKVDANGNCETLDKVDQNYLVESQMASFTLTSQEQECLLKKGELDQTQRNNSCETLTKVDDYTNLESTGSLQPTLALNSPTSALSDPMSLLSNTEPVSLQPSIQTQCTSQPTSPQIISPVTNSPHVNVNITLHLGNGSCGGPSFQPSDLSQADSKLPFAQEEECFSTPEQEAGSSSKASVQESLYCNT